MQTLGSALGDLARRNGLATSRTATIPAFDPRDPYDPGCQAIEGWQKLEHTGPRARELAAINEHLDLLPDPTADADPAQTERAMLLAKRRAVQGILATLRLRDALRNGRPDECWCLGLGGRHAMVTLASLPDCADVVWTQTTAVWDVTCPHCPEGQAAEARRLLAVEYANTTGRLDAHAHTLGLCEVPVLYQRGTLENYPVTAETRDAYNQVVEWDRRLAEGGGGQRGLWLWGEVLGAGKTSLACALLGKWQHRHATSIGLFVLTVDLLEAIRSARESGKSRSGLMEDAIERPFAVIDDLGSELDTPWVAEKLMSLINGRHNARKPTVFTSNLGPTMLHEQLSGGAFGNEWQNRQAQRIVSRLLEMCQVVHLEGPDLRNPEVRARLGLPPEPGAPAEALTLPLPDVPALPDRLNDAIERVRANGQPSGPAEKSPKPPHP